MPDRPIGVALGGDDEAHRILLERLADASTADLADLDTRRTFIGDGQGRPFLKLSQRPARETMPSGRPRFHSQRKENGQPLGYAAVLFEAAAALLERGDVAMVLTDEDGDASRHHHLGPARDALERRGATRVVLGVCDPIAEAWFVALIAPSRGHRARRLSAKLGFDVARHPEQLSASPRTSPRHAKRALHFLLDDAQDDPKACPASTPQVAVTEPALKSAEMDLRGLETLTGCGIAPFVAQLARVYAPLMRP